MDGFPVKRIVAGVGAFITFIFLLIFSPFTTVSNGTIGITTIGGQASEQTLTPGWHIISPFAKVHEISTQPSKAEAKGEAASRDLQEVHTVVTVNYKLNPDKAVYFYTKVGADNFEHRILDSAVQDALKAATSQYRAEELIAHRDRVRDTAKTNLKKTINELTNNSVVVLDIFFTNFTFKKDFQAAIEAAVTAEKQAIAEKNLKDVFMYKGQQEVEAAKGRALAMQHMRAQATPEYLKLKELEIEEIKAKKWNGALPQHMYGSAAIPFLNVNK